MIRVTTVWDWISLLALLLALYPAFRWIQTVRADPRYPNPKARPMQNSFYGRLFVGVLVLLAIVETTKWILNKWKVFKRPKGACHCNLFNAGGSYHNTCGMPSGHMAISTFVICVLLLSGHQPAPVMAWGLAVMVLVFIGESRIVKQCHTPMQVMLGMASGILATHIGLPWIVAG